MVTPRKEPQIRNRKNDDATNEVEAQRKVKMLMDRLNSGADFAQLAMDYSEDMNSAATGGDLGYVPESALNQSDPQLKKMVVGLKPGQVSPPVAAERRLSNFEIGHARISRAARTFRSAGAANHSRHLAQSQRTVAARGVPGNGARRSALHNYLAQQVIESAGKLPAGTQSGRHGKTVWATRFPPRVFASRTLLL